MAYSISTKTNLENLRKGGVHWNAFRAEEKSVQLRMYFPVNSDLRELDLSGANLSLCSIPGADLTDSTLSDADLSDTDLSYAKLVRTVASNSVFKNASLRGATLDGGSFKRCKFESSSLYAASLSTHHRFRFDEADAPDMKEVVSRNRALGHEVEIERVHSSGNVVFYVHSEAETDLSYSCLNGADLRKAVFSGTVLNGTSFGGARMALTTISCDISGATGLSSVKHDRPSMLSRDAISSAVRASANFLRGCGLSDWEIETLLLHSRSLSVEERKKILNEATPVSYHSCFISYSHRDKDFAMLLYDRLQVLGVRCWLDEKQMLPGDDIYDRVEQEIAMHDKLLLCCSESSLRSWWVDNEIDAAFEKERILMRSESQKQLSLIPLDLDGFMFSDKWQSGKKRQITTRIAGDFRNWKAADDVFEAGLRKLVLALRAVRE